MCIFRDFFTSTGRICLTSCISDIFNFYGYNVNESVIFATSQAKIIYYKPLNIEEVFYGHCNLKLFDIVLGGMNYDIYQIMKNVSDFWGVTLESSDKLSKQEVKKFITEHVHEKRPVLSLLSRKNLGYMNETFRDEMTHAINIIGEKENADKLYISDGYIPTVPISKYVGEISFEEYYLSLTSVKGLYNKKFSSRNIAFIAEDIHAINDYSTSSLLKPVKKVSALFLNSCLEDDVLTGRDACHRFVVDFENWLCINCEEQLVKVLRYVHHHIANYGGPVISNLLLAEYMKTLSERDAELMEIYYMFMELHMKWQTFANLAGKASFCLTEKTKVNLLKRLVEVVELEERVNSTVVSL